MYYGVLCRLVFPQVL
uniref:Uncharacterized protein n=1 Tax=Anguilla anguilla TaxID=7936 RepID=A0A0E9V6D1_ANGAN